MVIGFIDAVREACGVAGIDTSNRDGAGIVCSVDETGFGPERELDDLVVWRGDPAQVEGGASFGVLVCGGAAGGCAPPCIV